MGHSILGTCYGALDSGGMCRGTRFWAHVMGHWILVACYGALGPWGMFWTTGYRGHVKSDWTLAANNETLDNGGMLKAPETGAYNEALDTVVIF